MGEFTIDGILLPAGLHSARPAASAVAKGTLYSETDTLVVYQSDGVSTWTAWATLTGSGLSGGTPGLTLGTTNAAGAASTGIRTDATILVFDATNPTTQAFGDTPVVGTAGTAAHRDHKHGMPASPSIIIPTQWVKYTGGSYTLTNDTSWHDLDATNLNLTLAAAAGDILEFTAGFVASGFTCDFDVKLITAPNYVGGGVGGGSQGIASWAYRNTSTALGLGGVAHYAVVSGDISGGNVTARIIYTTGNAGASTVFATAGIPFFFSMKNLKH